jgi:hypothetical protein
VLLVGEASLAVSGALFPVLSINQKHPKLHNLIYPSHNPEQQLCNKAKQQTHRDQTILQSKTMFRTQILASFLFFLVFLSSSSEAALAQEQDSQLMGKAVDENDVIRLELEWAEHSLEGYKRQNDKFPLRSSIGTANHVHTDEWMMESVKLLLQEKSPKKIPKTQLRGSAAER